MIYFQLFLLYSVTFLPVVLFIVTLLAAFCPIRTPGVRPVFTSAIGWLIIAYIVLPQLNHLIWAPRLVLMPFQNLTILGWLVQGGRLAAPLWLAIALLRKRRISVVLSGVLFLMLIGIQIWSWSRLGGLSFAARFPLKSLVLIWLSPAAAGLLWVYTFRLNRKGLLLAAVLALIPFQPARAAVTPLAQYDLHHMISTLTVSPNARIVAFVAVTPAAVILLDWTSGREVARLEIPSGSEEERRREAGQPAGRGPFKLAFDSTGDRLTATSSDRRVYVWKNLLSGSPERIPIAGFEDEIHPFWTFTSLHRITPAVHGDLANASALAPGRDVLIVGGRQKEIRLFEFTHPAAPMELQILSTAPDQIEGLQLSPDGNLLVSVAFQSLKLWDLRDKSTARFLADLSQSTYKPWGPIVFGPDSRMVAYGGSMSSLTGLEGAVVLLDLSRSEAPREAGLLKTFRETCYTLAIRQDGKRAAAGFMNGTVLLWDISNPAAGKLIHIFKPANGCAALFFSPVGTLLTLATNGFLTEWEADSAAAAPSVVPNLQPGDLGLLQVHASLVFVTYPGIPYLRKLFGMPADRSRGDGGHDDDVEALNADRAAKVLNAVLDKPDFYSHVDDRRVPGLPMAVQHLLQRAKNHEKLPRADLRHLNKNLLLGVLGQQAFPKWRGFDETL